MAYEDLNSRFVNKNYDETTYEVVPRTDINEFYPTVDGIDSIKQGLLRLLVTPKGHNPYNRAYGSSLYSLLFENNVAISDIQMFLYMDITDWEPRVKLSPGDIDIIKLDQNTYKVSCNFVVPDFNVSSNITTNIAKE